MFWNQGGLWNHARQPAWTDAEWQIRNWLYFTWLSGDHIVEQHVHNIDVANWVMNAHPVKAIGAGGRQWRTDPKYGHIYDHFAVDFEYPNGARVMSMCRQIDGTTGKVDEHFIGAKGRASMSSDSPGRITGANAWTFERTGKPVSPYVQEHTDLIASIRAGKPLQRAEAGGREHAHGDHGTRGGVHGPGDHVGRHPERRHGADAAADRLRAAAGAAGPDAGRHQAGAEVQRVREPGS